MTLSIIIVNWNSVDYLRPCLQSIYRQIQGLDFEVIVVDNASYDGCAGLLREQFPQVRFLQSETNLGFGKANNLGAANSSGEVLLFLNPDTEILGTALPAMVRKLLGLPDAGALGCKLLNSDRSVQDSSVQAFPTIANQALDSAFLRRLFPRWRLWGNAALYAPETRPLPVEMISGACLMVRRAAFQAVGEFSSDYFMYADDLSLCYRLVRAGYRNYYTGAAQVVHHGGKSTKSHRSHFADVMIRESLCRFMRATRGWLYASAFRLLMGLSAVARLLLLAVIAPVRLGRAHRDALRHSFGKWKSILQWALGSQRWQKSIA